VYELKHLVSLDLAENQINQLPKEFFQSFTKLKVLNMGWVRDGFLGYM
jgi:hypothetical protein